MKIYIIIVNYKTEDLIGEAVKSFDEEHLDTHIVILDNGSTDESYKALRKAIGDDVEVIRNETNLGYSAGANYIIKHIQKNYDDLEYFFFFNPDAVATKNMLHVLYKTLSSYPTAAAVSPLIHDMEDNVYFNGMEITWDKCKIRNTASEIEDPNKVREIVSFHGCAVLIDANRFFEVNMFDEDLFIYYDEPFISMEFLNKGYVCLYEPGTLAYHHGSYSTGSESPFSNHLITRNHIMFFSKYGKSKTFLCPYRIPLWQMAYYTKHLDFKNVKAIFIGILDAIKGKTGAPWAL